MLEQITNYFKRPYHLDTSWTARLKQSFWYFLFVFLFLIVFKPFGLNLLPYNTVLICLGFGLCTFFVMLVTSIPLLYFFPNFFSEERWNVGREILWNLFTIVVIGFFNTVYSAIIQLVDFNIISFFVFEAYTLGVAIFPVTVSVLVKEKREKSVYEKDSESINEVLDKIPEPWVDSTVPALQTIAIKSFNENEQVILNLEDLLFIAAADNYVEVHFLKDGKTHKKLIRNSLKAVCDQMAVYSQLYRCHKSYLVNLKKVKHVSGNAQGFKLHIQDSDTLIPVSRSQNAALKNLLSA